jgi:F-type H+-transporting ATPase subunit gamma
MANLLDIRRRIRSVISTRQITKAMKMISAARLRRAQERALSARPYAQMLTNVLKSLVSRAEVFDPETGEPRHPLLARRPEKTVLLAVITGDRGLAGAFNTIESKQGTRIEIVCIGRKGRDFLRRRFPYKADQPEAAVSISGELVGQMGKLSYANAEELSERLVERYTKAEVDAVYFLFNEFKSVIAQRVVLDQVLPIGEIGAETHAQAEEMAKEQRERAVEAAVAAGVSVEAADTTDMDRRAAQFGTAQVDYIYEQPVDELFRGLLPKYVTVQIYHALIESEAAEHAARMTAMDSASNNASDMIDSLTLTMNRIRQAKITKEIIEIVSGAAAL